VPSSSIKARVVCPCQRMARGQAASEHHRFEQTGVRGRLAKALDHPDQGDQKQQRAAARSCRGSRTLRQPGTTRGRKRTEGETEPANSTNPQPAHNRSLFRCRALGVTARTAPVRSRGAAVLGCSRGLHQLRPRPPCTSTAAGPGDAVELEAIEELYGPCGERRRSHSPGGWSQGEVRGEAHHRIDRSWPTRVTVSAWQGRWLVGQNTVYCD